MRKRLSSSGSAHRTTMSQSVSCRCLSAAPLSPVDVLNLGVTFDAQLTMKNHVDNVVHSCFFHIRQLRSVRRSLTGDALRTFVHAFIACRVDYCNALLYGVADCVHRRLKSVLHAAARLFIGTRQSDHITSTLRDTLHWLPITQRRVTFKIALMKFDCHHGRYPKYLRDVCTRSRLWSADHGDLVVPRALTTRFGSRSFRIAGPSTWNGLPSNIRIASTREQFKRSLKSWLFECAYGRRRV